MHLFVKMYKIVYKNLISLYCKVPRTPEHRPRLTGRPWSPRPVETPLQFWDTLHYGAVTPGRQPPAACLQAGGHTGSHRVRPSPSALTVRHPSSQPKAKGPGLPAQRTGRAHARPHDSWSHSSERPRAVVPA